MEVSEGRSGQQLVRERRLLDDFAKGVLGALDNGSVHRLGGHDIKLPTGNLEVGGSVSHSKLRFK